MPRSATLHHPHDQCGEHNDEERRSPDGQCAADAMDKRNQGREPSKSKTRRQPGRQTEQFRQTEPEAPPVALATAHSSIVPQIGHLWAETGCSFGAYHETTSGEG